MAFCIKCGREVKHGAKFCHYCGAHVVQPKGRGLPTSRAPAKPPIAKAPAIKTPIGKGLGAAIGILVIIGIVAATILWIYPQISRQLSGGQPSGEQSLRAPLPDHPEIAKGYITPSNTTVQSTLNYIIANKPWDRTEFGAIQEWITSNISYAYDSTVHGESEYFQYPSETISLKTGDCEDFAILSCTLLRAYGAQPNSVYVVVGYGSSGGHAWLAENYRYGRWRYIEPQVDGNWFSHEDESAASAHVYLYPDVCYFNDQTFTKTKPFILPSEAGKATVTNVYWEIGGQTVAAAQTGNNVQAKVVLKAEGGAISGAYKIVVRKDIAWAPDEDCAQSSGSISLSKDASQILTLSWSPAQASGGSLRGYFVEFWFGGEKIYTMGSSYPPRLIVS